MILWKNKGDNCIVIMPYIWGEFESSLRGSKISADDLKKVLHKTCSGHAHGHGVAKESFLLSRIRALKINKKRFWTKQGQKLSIRT